MALDPTNPAARELVAGLLTEAAGLEGASEYVNALSFFPPFFPFFSSFLPFFPPFFSCVRAAMAAQRTHGHFAYVYVYVFLMAGHVKDCNGLIPVSLLIQFVKNDVVCGGFECEGPSPCVGCSY
jgi:hypothetical protein